ncbi:MAG: alanine racemase [Planctomycetota bacterium]|nr:alanine racemase [Planctomycetota bacterium]
MSHESTIEIDLDALVRNVVRLRGEVGPHCGLCAVVKADAYGLGAPELATTMVRAGVDMLAVYNAAQAEALADLDLRAPILALMPIRSIPRASKLHQLALAKRLHLVVHDLAHAHALGAIADALGLRLPVHFEFDTGMSRGGCCGDEADEVVAALRSHASLELAGVMTHFTDARMDPARTAQQLRSLDDFVRRSGTAIPKECVIHAANSHALLRDHATHRSMVRFGLAWTGLASDELPLLGARAGDGAVVEAFEPIVRWNSRIVQVRRVEAGQSVGYGSLWTARRRSTIGIVPVGYADGFPSTTGTGDPGSGPAVRVRGVAGGWFVAPLVGAVNMDQIAVDLTDSSVWSADPQRAIHAAVEVYGSDRSAPTHVARVAELAGIRPYELFCRMSPRIPRVHQAVPGGEFATLGTVESRATRHAQASIG